MPASVADVRTALADTIGAALPDVNCYRLPVDNPNPPCVIVAGRSTTSTTLDDLSTDRWDVFAAVSHRSADLIDGLDALTDVHSSNSVLAALAADPSLGGVVMSTSVLSVGDYRELTMGEVSYYAATLTVEVLR